MTGWNRRGEAVMAVMMGVMVIGGLVLWLTTGHFHMMPMGGGHGHGSRESGAAETGTHRQGEADAPPSGADEHGDHGGTPELRPGIDAP